MRRANNAKEESDTPALPVDWIDDPDSRVDIIDTARKDLRGIGRLGRALATGTLPLEEPRRAAGRERYGRASSSSGDATRWPW